MIVKTFEKLDEKAIEYFYNPLNYGVIVLRDKAIASRMMTLYESVEHKEFELKEHQDVNNGQKHYLFYLHERHLDFGLLGLLELYKWVRRPFGIYSRKTKLDYGVTEYPESGEGAKLHADFSYNVQVVVTMVFGETEFVVACDKEGNVSKTYSLLAGDILFMRAPRNQTVAERAMRPVHGFGKVTKTTHTLEIREVDSKRKAEVTKERISTPCQQRSRSRCR
jgi:hypothetical protein